MKWYIVYNLLLQLILVGTYVSIRVVVVRKEISMQYPEENLSYSGHRTKEVNKLPLASWVVITFSSIDVT